MKQIGASGASGAKRSQTEQADRNGAGGAKRSRMEQKLTNVVFPFLFFVFSYLNLIFA